MATPLNSLLYQVLRRSETDVKYTVGQGPHKAKDKMGGDVKIKTLFIALFFSGASNDQRRSDYIRILSMNTQYVNHAENLLIVQKKQRGKSSKILLYYVL